MKREGDRLANEVERKRGVLFSRRVGAWRRRGDEIQPDPQKPDATGSARQCADASYIHT